MIRAEGKSFTVGLDLMEAGALLTDTSAAGRETLRKTIGLLQDNISSIEKCRKPVGGLMYCQKTYAGLMEDLCWKKGH